MPDALHPTTGWAVVHLFCKKAPLADAAAITAAVKSCASDEHQVVTVAILGHKADIAVMAVGPDLWRLRRLQTELADAGLDIVDSYVSLTEVSEYADGMPDEMKSAIARMRSNIEIDRLELISKLRASVRGVQRIKHRRTQS